MLVVLSEEHRKNFRDLKKAFESLESASAAGMLSSSNQECLLRFYAAEVGLKFLLSAVRKLPYKHEAAKGTKFIESYSHDLPSMIAVLKIPASRVPAPPTTPHMCIGGFDDGSGGQKFALKAAHEAWRYGLTVDPTDLVALNGYFEAVINYLSTEIAA